SACGSSVFSPVAGPPPAFLRQHYPPAISLSNIASAFASIISPPTTMLYSSLVVAASAFAGLASAQGNSSFNTPIPCCTVPTGSVPSSEKSAWCEANVNTCVDICGGQANIASNGNSCDDSSLSFTCKCSNGTDAQTAIAAYEQSVPAQMCYYWYGQCVNATNQNLAQQFECEKAKNATCGQLKIDESGAVTTASASSSGAQASRTAGSSPSGSGSAAPAASTGAAATFAQYGAPVVAGGFLALFGLAL
ncbi:hypothetical protein JI435_037690, partial [Parastagonospora nodorum SN15]